MAQSKRLKKHLIILGFAVLGSFAFCFALVPLYNVFCKVAGTNGKIDGRPQPIIAKVDKNRMVTVELVSTLNKDTQAEFVAQDKKFYFHPGEYVETKYWVKNLTNQPMIVQAIPSVAPGQTAKHIKKIECFCFSRQELGPGEGMWLPLKFTVDPVINKKFSTLTLAYTLFDVTHS
jgi:cytochrome c oxidase assembly protein subunit 11